MRMASPIAGLALAALPGLASAQEEPGSLTCELASQCASDYGCDTEEIYGMTISLGTDGGEVSVGHMTMPLLPVAKRAATGASWLIEDEELHVVGLMTLSPKNGVALSLQLMSHEPPIEMSWTGLCTRSMN